MIINVMVTTIFGFGQFDPKDPPEQPFFGGDLTAQYTINQALAYTAGLLIAIMLCVKPCYVKFTSAKHVHEENQEIVYEPSNGS